jgi:hypothetical protein
VKHLERNEAFVAKISSEVDGRHSAGADLSLHPIALSEGRGQMTVRAKRRDVER